jgi:alkylhydroperoxidase/carboxymuconolactone decarboxylase family protein YurZ
VAPNTPLGPVTAALEKTGLTVDRVLEAIEMVIVHGGKAQAEQARKITGVTGVSKEVPVDIGPPDAEVW